MQLTVKQPMTVKEYAAEQHIAQQTVYKKISRNADKLQNHVFKMNGNHYFNRNNLRENKHYNSTSDC